MPFDWSSRSNDNLLERFPLGTVGLEAWHALVGRITVSDLSEAGYLSAFDAFLAAASQEHQNYRAQANKPQCQVFVSHQRLDVERAKRVAYLATQHNLDYWLDVHDPQLSQVPQDPSNPRYGILIAAIIEIALLNCTHIVAVHTSNSVKSKWVPYELGRAKARWIVSTQACGWFEPSLQPSTTGQEYVYLAYIAHGGENGLKTWFKFQQGAGALPVGTPCAPGNVSWSGPEPDKLP